MEIAQACRSLRQCNDAFSERLDCPLPVQVVTSAVACLKRYLEQARADGTSILELDLDEHLVCTPEGVRWVMPFVLSAESMLASAVRAQKERRQRTPPRS